MVIQHDIRPWFVNRSWIRAISQQFAFLSFVSPFPQFVVLYLCISLSFCNSLHMYLFVSLCVIPAHEVRILWGRVLKSIICTLNPNPINLIQHILWIIFKKKNYIVEVLLNWMTSKIRGNIWFLYQALSKQEPKLLVSLKKSFCLNDL